MQLNRIPSPLAQGRGLKPVRANDRIAAALSPLAQGRGLKLERFIAADDGPLQVAPRAGAWIETPTLEHPGRGRGKSPLAQGRGLKPLMSPLLGGSPPRRPSRRGVD